MASEQPELELDAIINMLVAVKGEKAGTEVNLPEEWIYALCHNCREVFLQQPMLLHLDPPLHVCGDIHGQFFDLLRLFEYGGFPPESNYLFLGDYVDRGRQSIESICLLFAFKLKYPQNFFLLRGNHEADNINKIYGFYDECKRRYSVKLWKAFSNCFKLLPVAAVIESRILCMHGGLSPELHSLSQIEALKRPCVVGESGLLCDLLWSDPERELMSGWGHNDRGVSFKFAEDVVYQMLEEFDLDLICRAHQVVEDGYEFFANRHLVTVFSAPNYCGEFDNAGAMMNIDESLMCSFQILKPSVDIRSDAPISASHTLTQALTHFPKSMTSPPSAEDDDEGDVDDDASTPMSGGGSTAVSDSSTSSTSSSSLHGISPRTNRSSHSGSESMSSESMGELLSEQESEVSSEVDSVNSSAKRQLNRGVNCDEWSE